MTDSQADIENQMRALLEVLVIYKCEITRFEAELWKAVMRAVPEESFIAFLQYHVRTSPFAPKISDAEKTFHPSNQNKDVAFEKMKALVKRYGPYQVPTIDYPSMLAAIGALGGWVTVNEELPASTDTYAVKQYKDRFDAVYQFGEINSRVKGLAAPEGVLAIAVQRPMSKTMPTMDPGPVLEGPRP